jgi:AdoMet-dependent heme synthase
MASRHKLPLAAQINIAASAANVPQSVLIELSYGCNLDCYYCYVDKSGRRPELKTDDWKRILDQLSAAGCLYATFSGGELFLRKDALSIIGYARKLNFAVSLISNGTLISRRRAEKLASLGVLDTGLSFHAAEKAPHDALSGKRGSFNKTLAALRLLKKLGVKVAVKHTVSKRNFGQFRKLAAMAKREGAFFECDSIVVPHGGYKTSPYALNEIEHREFLRFMKAKPAPLSCKGNPDGNLHCDAGRSVMGISPYGDVFPCMQLQIKLGNLRSRSIKSIWSGKKARDFRKKEAAVSAACMACEAKRFCGRCPGISFLETGDWRGKAQSVCDRTFAARGLALTPGPLSHLKNK